MRVKRNVALATATAAVAALVGGGAYAATQSSSPPSRQAFLADVAHRLGIPEAKLAAALKAARVDQLNQAVKDGRLTQAEADALAKRIQRGGPAAFGPPPFERRPFVPGGPGGPGGPGAPASPGGPGGPGGPWRPGAIGVPAHGPLAAAAGYLGLSTAQVVTKLGAGQTLAQIARAENKPVSGLEQAMTTAAKSRIAQAVKNGRITRAEAQQILGALAQRIENEINRKLQILRHPTFRPPPLGPFGGPGHPA